eukprot:TRINITY_DN1514_c0_g2_i1.p1 TRINITY_DN1514_c0_g2~~TRINITY_DN1514_c0_g2_i1.p1  ORF type:complete len:1150 (+),score=399.61 TRINITY_DN1514_c0_g2_i1:130-3579(+)
MDSLKRQTRRMSSIIGERDRKRAASGLEDGSDEHTKQAGEDDYEPSELDESNMKELAFEYLQDQDEEEEDEERLMQLVAERDWRQNEDLCEILGRPAEEFDEFEDFDPQAVSNWISHGVLRYPQQAPAYMVDHATWWSTESEEVHDFRRMVAESAERDEDLWKEAHPGMMVDDAHASLLLPRYFVARMDPSQEDHLQSSTVTIEVLYAGFDPITERIEYTEEAQNFIAKCYTRFRDRERKRHAELAIPENHALVLKFVGRADYLWGATKLIDFLHVRKAVMSTLPAKLQLLAVHESRLDDSMVKYTYQDDAPKVCNPAHEDLSIDSANAIMNTELSLWDMDVWMDLEVRALSNVVVTAAIMKEMGLQRKEGEDLWVCVVGQLYHGTQALAEPASTPWTVLRGATPGPHNEVCTHAVWGTPGRLRFAIQLRNLPRDTRLCLSVVASNVDPKVATVADPAQLVDCSARTKSKKVSAKLAARVAKKSKEEKEEEENAPAFGFLGWVNYQIFDHTDYLRQGAQVIRLWVQNEKANPIGVVATPKNDGSTAAKRNMTVMLALPKFARPIRYPHGTVPAAMRRDMIARQKQMMNELEPGKRKNLVNQLRQVRTLIQQDPLYELGDIDKLLLWQFRNDLITSPTALPKVLMSVDWASPAAVQEIIDLLHHPDPSKRWTQPPEGRELIALPLLDARFANGRVRDYAVRILDRMHDSQLAECVLQLVQVLKYEPYHNSAVARFLLKRSIANPHQIGHPVFWHLKAEMCNPQVQERHGLLIEEMLKRSQVRVRRDFAKQDALIELLLKTAMTVKTVEGGLMGKNQFVREELDSRFQDLLPGGAQFTLPLDPRMEVTGLYIEKCKVMGSKKLPLWLVFKNADPLGDPILVIFKAGDDLRQDLLTLQMLALMDSFWKRGGLDLHMSPYGCVACDDGVGMIEVVVNSDTIANITYQAGGASAAFHEDPLINWLRQNECNRADEDIKSCMWNFLYSTAGYCVATYILGIGDRHNDNIMLKKNGTLFHIDFGHFLGNFKKKFGIDRETAPFVFTPMYAYVLGKGGKDDKETSKVYDHFCYIACTAYNIARKHRDVIISLFSLMLSTGIPELTSLEDMHWLRHVLAPKLSDTEAARAFALLIKESLNNKRTRLNDYIHIQWHKGD